MHITITFSVVFIMHDTGQEKKAAEQLSAQGTAVHLCKQSPMQSVSNKTFYEVILTKKKTIQEATSKYTKGHRKL